MNLGEILTYVMLLFAIIGGLDKALGNKFGPGTAFEKGFNVCGPLILVMIGPMTIAPLISEYVSPLITPFFNKINIDPSVIAGIFLANDCGGWPLALALAEDPSIGKFSGSILGSVIGATIICALPFCFMIIPKEKHQLAAKGLIIGIITIPVTCFVGGLLFKIPIISLIYNLIPELLFSLIFIIGLKFFEKFTIKAVTIFGYVLSAVITLSLLLAIIIKTFKMDFKNLEPFDNSIVIIGGIAIFLSGAFTMLYFIEKLFSKSLGKIGKKIGVNAESVLGLITSSVNAIPTFSMTEKMNDRGVIMNVAFIVCGAYVFGDHLAFQATVDTTTVLPLIVSKLAGGILAIILTLLLTKKEVTE